jgi:hypothetical protein
MPYKLYMTATFVTFASILVTLLYTGFMCLCRQSA